MLKKRATSITRMVSKALKSAFIVCALLVFTGSLNGSKAPSVLESVIKTGELHIVSRNGPTTYYEDSTGLVGFEYAIAERFAKKLGVELVLHDQENLRFMIDSVKKRQVHFAAAGLTITPKRQKSVKFSHAYLDISQQVIYRAGESRPKSIKDIQGKNILVIGNSAHTEHLRKLQRDFPGLQWKERTDLEMLDLLEMVHNGEIDYTIVDSNAYRINESVYPKARVAFDIKEFEQLAWAFPRQKDQSLYNEAQNFFREIKETGFIEDTLDTYYGHLGELDYSGSLLFAHRLNTRLPRWEQKIKEAADQYDLDWQLMAALSYQESHWNPKAKSPTGVRGFMMLTRNTAKDMGVKNRLDPDQSIAGGAKYFKSIYSRIPQRIQNPDRTWLALAAYNVGLGHVEDARILTEHHGADPDKWADVSENLLLLAKRKYYKFTKHGYARGWEAVDYVQNIRNFHSIIAWSEKEKDQQLHAHNSVQGEFENFSPVVSEAVKTITISSR